MYIYIYIFCIYLCIWYYMICKLYVYIIWYVGTGAMPQNVTYNGQESYIHAMQCDEQKQGMHIKFNPSTAAMRLNVEVPAICGLAWIFHMYWPCSMPLLFWSKHTDPTQQVPKTLQQMFQKKSPKSTEIRLSHLDLLVGHQPRRPNLPELPLGMA